MVKRCIGIDMGSRCLRAVQLAQTDGRLWIEKVFVVQMRRSTDSPSHVLKTLVGRQGFDRRADVAVAMPPEEVFFRNLETDAAGLEQMQVPGSSVLHHCFPIQPDEIAAAVCSHRQLSDERYSVLVAAVGRASLRERLNVFTGAGFHPDLVGAAIFAVHSTIVVNHPEVMAGTAVIAYIDESYLSLAITRDNNVLIVRNIPIPSCSGGDIDTAHRALAELLSREVRISWRKVFGAETERDCRIYLAGAGGACDDFRTTVEENLNCQVVLVDPYAGVEVLPKCKLDVVVGLAEGLALSLLVPGRAAAVNFIEADNADTKPASNLKKECIICAVLVAAIAAVSMGALFMRLSHLEAEYAQVKDEIREVFQSALPEEKNIVKPAEQLEQRLDSLRKSYRLFASFCPSGLAPLEVLGSITAGTASQDNMKIENLLITAESVQLSGVCDSFESVYRWQRLLEQIHEFTLVEVEDVQRDSESGVVRFTMLISSASSANVVKALAPLPVISERK